MTLPELLISVSIIGLIAAVLSSAIIVTFRQGDSTEGRINVARAEQSINTWLPADLAHRLARAYGTRVTHVIGNARSVADLGRAFAPGLHEAELAYLRDVEWARSAQDVLWRRSKLGLHVEPGTLDSITHDIDAWLAREPFRQSA